MKLTRKLLKKKKIIGCIPLLMLCQLEIPCINKFNKILAVLALQIISVIKILDLHKKKKMSF